MRKAHKSSLQNLFSLQVCTKTSPLKSSSTSDCFFTIEISSLNPKCYAQSHRFLFLNLRKYLSTVAASKPPKNPASQIECTKNFSYVIAKSVISTACHLWEKKDANFAEHSLQSLLNRLDFMPSVVRRLRRVSELKAQDFLEILLNFEAECRKTGLESTRVESLWKLFAWSAGQNGGFNHLPQSYKIMLSVLTRAGRLGEAQSLLGVMGARGVWLDDCELYSEMIEKFVDSCELNASIAIYAQARGIGVVLSKSCFRAALRFCIRMEEIEQAQKVYMDMVEAGYGSNEENYALEIVVRNLCIDGKIQEARNLVRKVKHFGILPNPEVVDMIADGYCEKRDFEDLMNFLSEENYVPNARICNKLISFLCITVGTEGMLPFLQKLEALGFIRDETTFGILICYSCRERKLKCAFIYLSELLARNMKPSVLAYNALIGGVFKEGIGMHAKDVFCDMIDKGVTPDLSTFRTLLAGYSRERKFDEVRVVVGEMVKYGLVSMSPVEDVLFKAFGLLGLDQLGVKVKRDKGIGITRAEFFDALGNGFYLEADVDKYERILTGILDDSVIPDFNPVVQKKCKDGDIEAALRAKREMIHWGQQLSMSSFSELLKTLCSSESYVVEALDLYEEMAMFSSQLDQATLNLLIQATSKKGMAFKGQLILGKMLQRKQHVDNNTHTTLILGLWKNKNMRGFQQCWDLAQKSGWLPKLEDYKTLLSCLFKWGMLKEAFKLFENVVELYPCQVADIGMTFVVKLCASGFSGVACILMDEFLKGGLDLGHATYNHIGMGFCKEKRFREAFRILDIMMEKNLMPPLNMCKLLFPWFCRLSRIEKATLLKWISMIKQTTTPITANILLNGLCSIGKIYEATFELGQMLMKGIDIVDDTFDLMLHDYYRGNNLYLACELLCTMVRRNIGLSVSGYRSLVHMMCMQCQIRNALKLKDFMLKEGKCPHLVIYNILIFCLFKRGKSSEVEKLLDEMHEKHLVFDDATYNFLIYGHYWCKNGSKLMETFNWMINKNLRPSKRSFRVVFDYLCSQGELEKALELSRLMESRGWIHGSVVQSTLVLALISSNRFVEAKHFLLRMVEKGLIPDNISYDILIKKFCAYGKLKTAVELLDVMLKKSNLPSDICYNLIIGSFCISKEFGQALDFHAEMLQKNLVPSIESHNSLVCGLCMEGRAHEAEKILGVMRQFGQTPTRIMYQSVIDKYYSDKNLDKVSELLHQMQRDGYEPDFMTHWSLISNLSSNDGKDVGNRKSFLSELLSVSGFAVDNFKGKRS